MSDERRVVKRRHLIYYLRVWDVGSGDLIGHLADVTTEGIMVVSPQAIPKGREYTLELRWQGEGGSEEAMRFRAESRWSHNDVNPDFYDTGFLLLDESPTLLNHIADIIEDLGFND